MIKEQQAINSHDQVDLGSDRLTSVLAPESAAVIGSPTPRIHSPLNDLPSKGPELIDFAKTIFPNGFMPWQEWAAIHSHKVKPDGRWATPLNCIVVARQSGKSTLISLLLRLYPVNEGEILIDGVNVNEFTLESVRKVFSLVSQDIFLFNDTVRENLTTGDDHTKEEIQTALEISYASEFVKDLPDGLETSIGDRGLRLSGGQCQRLTIARAFLKNRDVLLFDEATSALDNESEKIVQQALDRVAGHKTVVAVAHRLSTLKDFHRIVVMKDGSKVEEGTHQSLMSAGGEYQKLYELSYRD
jgi:ABC-type multidrug transport system fused ATPase/permease subunit